MTDDAEFLLRYSRDRSEAAFVEIVHRRLDSVYSAALRRVGGDAHLAQDVAQNVFIALAQKAKSLASHPFLSGWLYSAARIEAANVVRAEQRRKAREQEAQAMADQNAPGDQADWHRLAPILDEAIDQLGEPDRRLILLRFVDRRRYTDISAALEIKEDAARMRTERALDKLRSVLERHGITSTAAALEFILAENAVGAVPAGVVSAVTQAALAGGASTVGAAGIGAALVGLFTSSTLVTAVMTVASLAAAAYEFRLSQDAAGALASSQASYREAAERLNADQHRIAELRSKARDSESGPRKRRRIVIPNQGRAEALAVGKAFLARHPDVQAAYTAWQDAMTHAEYFGLYKSLGLSPRQIKEFESLMRSEIGADFAMARGGVMAFPTDGLSEAQRNGVLAELLGPEGYSQFLGYTETNGPRSTTSSLASDLIENGSPLTPQQSQQMLTVFAQAKVGQQNQGAYNWDQVMTQAQGILSPQQLSLLGDVRTISEAQQERKTLQ